MSKHKECIISPYVYVGIRIADLPAHVRATIRKRTRKYNQSIIIEAVQKVTGVTFEQIHMHKRTIELVTARQIYCHQMRDKLPWSLKEIGLSINRDHTTVIYALEAYSNLYETDSIFMETANRVENELDELSSELIVNLKK
jgi:chromosomal replication initiation ATPase DnaA